MACGASAPSSRRGAERSEFFNGLLTADGSFTYTWDCENRLVQVEPASTPETGDKKLEFVYDYLGRRVRKLVYGWDPNAADWSATPELDRRFVYYNWLPLVEYEGPDNSKVRKYVWGLDLAGRDQSPERERGVAIDAAGGIGGLIAMRDVTGGTNYVCFYDGNGNLGQLIDRSDGSVDARYEYDAYGNNLLDASDPNESGPYADDNPIRLSTKYWDDETGLGYWGYRYYNAALGRWIARDPVEEDGGFNVYRFVENRPTSAFDNLGQFSCDCCAPGETCFAQVEVAFVASRHHSPDDMKYVVIALAAVEALSFVGHPGPPRCDRYSGTPTPGHTSGAFMALIGAMRSQNTGSLWHRYKCKECTTTRRATPRPWWAWIFAPNVGWNTCPVWRGTDWTDWTKCNVNYGIYRIGMHGIPN